ncbi:hypothetical protein BJF78_15240 [Pseudonocardia sp. CNS-139]|nr:hypothetical protein BJF78_15240 [Pseudonocardia sp. CNS-139]
MAPAARAGDRPRRDVDDRRTVMRRLVAPLVLAALLALAGCGGPGGSALGSADADGDPATDIGFDIGNAEVPECPFTEAQATQLVGEPLVDEGNCLFGDGKGVASLSVTMASETAGLVTYDYQREQADSVYDQVTDIDAGDQAYLAVKDIAGEAVVVSPSGSYTITLSSFERLGDTPGGYEQVLRGLVDALPL